MKMKKIFVLLLVVTLCMGCNNKPIPPENVPTRILAYEADGTLVTEGVYDEYGNIIKSTQFDADGNEISVAQMSYEYDKYGNITKCTYETDDESWIEEYKYTYESDMIATCEQTKDGESLGDFEYENGKLVKHTRYYSENEVTTTAEYEYDNAGNLVKVVHTQSKPESETILEYTYDGHDNVVTYSQTMVMNSEEQTMSLEYENEYDEEGRLIKTKHYNVTDEEKEFTGHLEYEYE